MEILSLTTNELNQNNYHKNILTQDKIGALFTFPNGYVPDDCLSCDGYILKIEDYLKLYTIIGTDFNDGTEDDDEFRIPDYNITGRFLQPGSSNFGAKISAGLPGIELLLRVDGGATAKSYYGGSYLSDYGTDDYGGAITTLSSGSDEYMFQMSDAADNRKAGDLALDTDIYGNSDTVQPPSQIVHICIKYK